MVVLDFLMYCYQNTLRFITMLDSNYSIQPLRYDRQRQRMHLKRATVHEILDHVQCNLRLIGRYLYRTKV